MNSALKQYIDSARAKGHKDDQIKRDLIDGGWDAVMVEAGLKGENGLEVPPPPPAFAPPKPSPTDTAVKVVAMKTTAGLEYIILFLSMWITALALGGVLHSFVDNATGQDSFYTEAVSFSSSALIVALPIFAWLFLKLKKQEGEKPEIRRDQNRKSAVQLTLIVTFIVGLSRLIFYVYQLLNTGNNDSWLAGGDSLIGNLAHAFITVGIAGGIFAYYWIDEHRKDTIS